MEYLFRPRSEKGAAHIWTGNDTACRMWSTGGIKNKNDRRWARVELALVPPTLCTMCRAVSEREPSLKMLAPLTEFPV